MLLTIERKRALLCSAKCAIIETLLEDPERVRQEGIKLKTKTLKPYYDVAYSSLCIRCGEMRLVSKKWAEKVRTPAGEFEVRHTETVCPNKECQELVDDILGERQLKKEEMALRKSARMAEIKARRSIAHAT